MRPDGASHLSDRPNRNGSYGDRVMAKRQLLSPEVLRQLLSYAPDTGKLFWKERGPEWFEDHKRRKAEHACRNWNARFSGKEAFTAMNNGYRTGQILGENVRAHRACWAIFYGAWPREEIDHINRVKDDNRIYNLRESTRHENLENRGAVRGKTSGYVGVHWCKFKRRWRAEIHPHGLRKDIKLGYFTSELDAAKAYDKAALAYRGKFAKLNFPEEQYYVEDMKDASDG